MGMNRINTKTDWGVAAADINSNFDTLTAEVTKLKYATTRNKGYYSDASALLAGQPVASVGDIAFVGVAYPYAIWKWTGDGWMDSGETGGDESVNLGDYYTKAEIDSRKVVLTEEEWDAMDAAGSWVEGVEYEVYEV